MARQDRSEIEKKLKALTAGLDTDALHVLHVCESAYRDISRKQTGSVFLLGRHFAAVKECLPGKWEKWVRLKCEGVTKRTLTNYIAVWREFSPRSTQIEKTNLRPAHLYALLGASEAIVDNVLRAAERNERITTRMIHRMKDAAATTALASESPSKGADSVTSDNVPASAEDIQSAAARERLESALIPRLRDLISSAIESAADLMRQIDRYTGQADATGDISQSIARFHTSVMTLSVLCGDNESTGSGASDLDRWREAANAVIDLPAHLDDAARLARTKESLLALLESGDVPEKQPRNRNTRKAETAPEMAKLNGLPEETLRHMHIMGITAEPVANGMYLVDLSACIYGERIKNSGFVFPQDLSAEQVAAFVGHVVSWAYEDMAREQGTLARGGRA